MGSVDFQQISGRNFAELFQRKLDRDPAVRKLSELNGADRKQTGSIGSVAGKQRKQSVPTVRTVDLGREELYTTMISYGIPIAGPNQIRWKILH